MNNFFRAIIAGAAAKKFGGGCLGMIVIFAIVWVILGQCSSSSPIRENSKPVFKENQVTTSLFKQHPTILLLS
jgi:phosphotransferase system  glucose/maltose/N-acetylglucosamine-specific IIC component